MSAVPRAERKARGKVAAVALLTVADINAAIEAGHLTDWVWSKERAKRLRREGPAWYRESRAKRKAERRVAGANQRAAAVKATEKRERSRKTWATQTELGVVLGMSAVAVGKVLTEVGLRADGVPTEQARADRLAIECDSGQGKPYYRWAKWPVLDLLAAAGHGPADPKAQQARKSAAAQATRERRAREVARMSYDLDEWGDHSQDAKQARMLLDSADDPDLAWKFFSEMGAS